MPSVTLSDTFLKQLKAFEINIDEDALEYMTGMLADMQVSDESDVRGSTESFLADANVDDATMDAFYTAVFKIPGASIETSKERVPKPVLLKKTGTKSEETKKSVSQESIHQGHKESRESSVRTKRRGKKGAVEDPEDPNTHSDAPPTIVAISQQSRFHRETRLDSVTKEIDLMQVNISVNQVELLVDAHLKIKPGVRYGLVGQNGVGKTVLMKCMADNILVGLPQNLHILHIAQLEVHSESNTVLSEVLSSDKAATEILREAQEIQKALGSNQTVDSLDKDRSESLNQVIFDIMVSRAKVAEEDAAKIATRRSGARGRDARQHLVKMEQEYAELTAQDPKTYITAQMTHEIVTSVFEKSELIDINARSAKAQRILKGIGFTEEQINAPVKDFSGGWRMKIALAKSLFIEPDILLLDEPTNHLDLPAILWLQDYLMNDTNDLAMVVVSHDREFLNTVCEETIIFKDKTLRYHPNNYEDWEQNTEQQRVRKQAMLDATEKRRKTIMASIQQNMQRAKATGDDKRHGMVNSRKKKLDRLGMEKTEDGKRFKVSYHAGFHSTSHVQIEVEQGVKTAKIKVPDPQPLRYHGSVFTLKSASYRYPKTKKNIFSNFSIDIEPGSRVAFLGSNGSGKSTLLNVLTGNLQPTSGELYRHPMLRVGYFSQHLVDQLDLESTPVEEMRRRFPNLSEQECRAYFGTVGVSGKVVLRKIKYLSGGQRNRVAFSLILQDEPHVLILDEITNHLDMGTVEMLVEALAGYSGALVLVSHDVWFLKQLMENVPKEDDDDDDTDEAEKSTFYTVKDGQVKQWEKGMEAYVSSVLRQVRKNK
ncbi:P-loop containing nucleoside triphosphate hydrolase protein [Phycomyces nitens]|nr:P-loop containing nucleoside triphosphate hydrolase protein [Phycomyces nitens]